MAILEIVPGVFQMSGFPRNYINSYLVGDVLIDAGTRWAQRRLFRQLRGRTVRLVALTHCHPDHQGVVRVLCDKLGVPLACHEADVAAVEGRAAMLPDNFILRLGVRCWAGSPCPVSRILRDGDEVGPFRVIHTPGHTPGHVLYFRDADRLAIAGDVLANLHVLTGRARLREPPRFFSADSEQNRRSLRKLVELRPAIVCFGHGPPLRDPALLEAFAARFA
jgi:glyoxylase-like metal-dependent hydrolase (beta-lactamase superfamily II)